VIYETMEFIRTNCVMRKGKRLHVYNLENLSNEDVGEYIWNFCVDKEDVPAFLESLLSCLNEEEKKIIQLRFFENKTFRQMVEDCNISFQGIHKKFHKALEKMRKYARFLQTHPRLDL